MLGEEFSHGGLVRGLGDHSPGLAIETHDVREHAIKTWTQQIAALREQRVQCFAIVFKAGLLVADAEPHGRGFGSHAEFIQQCDEVRVRPVIKDNKSGVDGVPFTIQFDVDGVGVPAEIVVGFKQGDLVIRVQAIGRNQSRDSRADDRQLHDRDSISRMWRAGKIDRGRVCTADGSVTIPTTKIVADASTRYPEFQVV